MQPELTPVESSSENDSNEEQNDSPPPHGSSEGGEKEPSESVVSDDVNLNDSDISMVSEKSSNDDSVQVLGAKR